jgi:hypothetical protein
MRKDYIACFWKRITVASMVGFHDQLKAWLVTLGKENGYESWTPDEQNNYEFSKIRNAKVDYIPDVIWKKRGEKVIFELAFTESTYAVIGKMFLAAQVENFSKIYFIRRTEHTSKWEEVSSFLRYAFKKDEGLLKTYKAHRPGFILLDADLLGAEIKERIQKQLKDDNWIKKA